MTIQSSTFAVGVPQVDGRVWVDETHIDSVQGEITHSYLGDATNAAAVMAARVASINEQLAAAEFEALIRGA